MVCMYAAVDMMADAECMENHHRYACRECKARTKLTVPRLHCLSGLLVPAVGVRVLHARIGTAHAQLAASPKCWFSMTLINRLT
jgi:hypothetical protein